MSYIHEALNKAQIERDSRYRKYGSLSVRGKETRFFDDRTVRLASLVVFTIFIAFALYSWLDCIFPEKSAISEIKNEGIAVAPQSGSVVNIEGFYEKARGFHKKGHFQDAIRLYKETLEADPGHVDALNNLGVIYLHLNEFNLARSNFEKAIRLSPEYVNSYYNLACLHARSGGISQSLAILKKAFSLDESVREWAQRDADLKNLHGEKEFQDLISGQGIRNTDVE